MLSKKELKLKKLNELKQLAKDNDISLTKGIKKDEIITLLAKKLQEVSGKQEKTKNNLQAENEQEQTLKDFTPNKIDFNKIPDLPHNYGKDKLVFMIKDPNWGFVYWEFSENLSNFHGIYDSSKEKYLRVYDITDGKTCENPNYYIDVKINLVANNWYLDFLVPNKVYIIEMGYFRDADFIKVLRSNSVITPRDAVSDQIDQEWMLTDEQFRILLMASGINKMGSSEISSRFASKI